MMLQLGSIFKANANARQRRFITTQTKHNFFRFTFSRAYNFPFWISSDGIFFPSPWHFVRLQCLFFGSIFVVSGPTSIDGMIYQNIYSWALSRSCSLLTENKRIDVISRWMNTFEEYRWMQLKCIDKCSWSVLRNAFEEDGENRVAFTFCGNIEEFFSFYLDFFRIGWIF